MSLIVLLLAWLAALATPVDPVDAVLGRKPLETATVAVVVADAHSGELLLERAPDLPLIPASNMKLLTTAAAVTLLGADATFATRVLSSGPPGPDGVVGSDVVLLGDGDPCLRADVLAPDGIVDPAAFLAGLLHASGLRRVDGALVLDDGLLDREWVHPDWELEDLDYGFAAPVGALSIQRNCLELSVSGRSQGQRPSVALLTRAEGYRLRNETNWSTQAGIMEVGGRRPDDGGVVRVRGRVSHGTPSSTIQVAVRDGALLFGRCLLWALDQQGVTVRGGLQREAGSAAALPDPHELLRFETPLSRAVLLANKESDNSISDHLFKRLGALAEGEGSFRAGARAVRRFLTQQAGADAAGLVLSDGSGLARSNRVTARALVQALVAMNRKPGHERDLFLRSLPVSGRDGTLRDRLTDPPHKGAVRAKTGYISGVSALSGYVTTTSGRLLAFSILINDIPAPYRNRHMKVIQDDVCRALVGRW